MKRLIEKMETLLVAVTFAEAGEHEISRRILGMAPSENRASRVAPAAKALSR